MVEIPAALPFVPLITGVLGAGAAAYSGYKANQANERTAAQMEQTQQRQMGAYDQANALIPGMQGISSQYGTAAQGLLGDRTALGALGQQYSPLMEQMQRLYSQNPAEEGVGLMRGLYNQDVLGGEKGVISQMQSAINRSGNSASADALRANAQGVLGATSADAYRAQAQLAGNDAMGQLSSQLASRGIASSGSSSRLGASALTRLYADAQARGQQDRLNAYGISNSALSTAGSLDLQAQGQQSGMLGNLASLLMQNQSQRAGLAGQMANLGLAGQQQQAGLLGQQAGLLGQQQQNVLAQSGLLGNYLSALQGQYGMQQGIAGQYMQQGSALGGVYQQQGQNINPNPYGGMGAALGSIGNGGAYAANYFQNQRAGGATGLTGLPLGNMGVQYRPAVMPYQPY